MRIAVIGAGPTGIAAGRELLRRGFDDLVIFDALDAPGGTWRQQSYPGLACDVWAHSYTFSYAPNPDWSASFAGYAEIQRYFAGCAERFGLGPYLRLNTEVSRAEYTAAGRWALASDDGPLGEFDVLINAMGNQHTPLYPEVEGMDQFQGPSWHSTEWNHDEDLTGRRVVVVGSAAAAVQIVPEIAKTAGHLTVLQRSANWIMPRRRKFYSRGQRWRFRYLPGWIALTRWVQRTMMGQVQYAVTHGHSRMGQFEEMVKKFINDTIDDPELAKTLVPDTRYGCKRGLVSDDFYPALNRDNVDLVPTGLKAVTPTGILTQDGREIEADVIVYCTGYKILDYDRFAIVGKDGQVMGDVLKGDPRAYKGLTLPGFPNYFFAMGPNALVLNVPYVMTAERNVATITDLLATMREQSVGTLDTDVAAFDSYNRWMDGQFSRFSWGSSDCRSYYTAGGHPAFLYPGSFKSYNKMHRAIGLEEFQFA